MKNVFSQKRFTPGNAHLVEPGGKFSKTQDGRESISVLRNLLQDVDDTLVRDVAMLDLVQNVFPIAGRDNAGRCVTA